MGYNNLWYEKDAIDESHLVFLILSSWGENKRKRKREREKNSIAWKLITSFISTATCPYVQVDCDEVLWTLHFSDVYKKKKKKLQRPLITFHQPPPTPTYNSLSHPLFLLYNENWEKIGYGITQ